MRLLRLHRSTPATCALAVCASVVCFALTPAAPLSAQSSAYATVSGTVSDAAGAPVGQAVVTLSPLGSEGSSSLESSTDGSGGFTIALVRPGSYELRIEAVGYRPLVARTLVVAGGDDRSVDLTLTVEPPPVLTVDTVMLAAAAASSRRKAGAMRLGRMAVETLPHRTGGLASIASLSTAFDETLGAQGLTGSETLVVADGVPFYRAVHPSALAEAEPMPLFPAGLLGSVTPMTEPADIEAPGVAGGYVGVATRSSTAGPLEGSAAYSGDPIWFSDELDFETPSLLSFEGTLRGSAPVRDDGSQVVVAADVLGHETPLTPRLTEPVATDLAGLDADVLAGLTEPAVERYSRYAGLARVDLNSGAQGRTFLRAAGSYSRRAFEGAGPLPASPAPALAEESVDVSLAGGYLTQATRRTTVELRGGVSHSTRDLKAPFGGLPPTRLAESASILGSPSYAAGQSSRTDVLFTPMLRHIRGARALKAGLALRVSNHTMERGAPDLGGLIYSDADALLADRGYLETVTAPDAAFGTQEYGIFAQYDAPLSEGMRLRLGARYDREQIGSETPRLSTDLRDASGLANDEYPTSFNQFGLGGALTWDPTTTGRTQVTVSASLREGDVDPRALFEVLAHATDATSVRYLGDDVQWPEGSVPSGATELPTLTLLGPDTRPPRTTSVSVGLQQRLTATTTFFLEGSTRRTDFLMRRRNLNLPVSPQFTDPDGRAVYGTLEQDGALVVTTGDDGRRFSDFGEVWALDPDGWSEYRGVTLGIEHGSPQVDLFGSYSWSETTDNRVGAARAAVAASLRPGLPAAEGEDEPWDEGVSDLDVPHRVAGGVTVRAGLAEVSGLYRYRSGLPFTPGYRVGVDANGDGSVRNDVAYVPSAEDLGTLLDVWSCLEDQTSGFAVRNSCRGPDRHSVSLRMRFRLGELSGRTAVLTLDGLDLIEYSGGIVDDALLLVDPDGTVTTSEDGSTVTIPVRLNDAFDTVRYPSSRGRMLRIGVRIGG